MTEEQSSSSVPYDDIQGILKTIYLLLDGLKFNATKEALEAEIDKKGFFNFSSVAAKILVLTPRLTENDNEYYVNRQGFQANFFKNLMIWYPKFLQIKNNSLKRCREKRLNVYYANRCSIQKDNLSNFDRNNKQIAVNFKKGQTKSKRVKSSYPNAEQTFLLDSDNDSLNSEKGHKIKKTDYDNESSSCKEFDNRDTSINTQSGFFLNKELNYDETETHFHQYSKNMTTENYNEVENNLEDNDPFTVCQNVNVYFHHYEEFPTNYRGGEQMMESFTSLLKPDKDEIFTKSNREIPTIHEEIEMEEVGTFTGMDLEKTQNNNNHDGLEKISEITPSNFCENDLNREYNFNEFGPDHENCNSYFLLDIKKIKCHLIEGNDNLKELLLQALRWRITKTDEEVRCREITEYIKYNLFGLNVDDKNESILKICFERNSPEEKEDAVKEKAARLLNCFASLSAGRDYLCRDEEFLSCFLFPFIMKSRFKSYFTHAMLIATLQKLSVRTRPRLLMISGGLIEYLVAFLSIKLKILSEYCIEYATALLMNLCLQKESKPIYENISYELIELMTKFLFSTRECALPFVCGILFTILRAKTINEEAKNSSLGVSILHQAKITRNEEIKKQLEVIYRIHVYNQLSICPCRPLSESTGVDFLEPELDSEDCINGAVYGEKLLYFYRLQKEKNVSTDHNLNLHQSSCFCSTEESTEQGKTLENVEAVHERYIPVLDSPKEQTRQVGKQDIGGFNEQQEDEVSKLTPLVTKDIEPGMNEGSEEKVSLIETNIISIMTQTTEESEYKQDNLVYDESEENQSSGKNSQVSVDELVEESDFNKTDNIPAKVEISDEVANGPENQDENLVKKENEMVWPVSNNYDLLEIDSENEATTDNEPTDNLPIFEETIPKKEKQKKPPPKSPSRHKKKRSRENTIKKRQNGVKNAVYPSIIPEIPKIHPVTVAPKPRTKLNVISAPKKAPQEVHRSRERSHYSDFKPAHSKGHAKEPFMQLPDIYSSQYKHIAAIQKRLFMEPPKERTSADFSQCFHGVPETDENCRKKCSWAWRMPVSYFGCYMNSSAEIENQFRTRTVPCKCDKNLNCPKHTKRNKYSCKCYDKIRLYVDQLDNERNEKQAKKDTCWCKSEGFDGCSHRKIKISIKNDDNVVKGINKYLNDFDDVMTIPYYKREVRCESKNSYPITQCHNFYNDVFQSRPKIERTPPHNLNL